MAQSVYIIIIVHLRHLQYSRRSVFTVIVRPKFWCKLLAMGDNNVEMKCEKKIRNKQKYPDRCTGINTASIDNQMKNEYLF